MKNLKTWKGFPYLVASLSVAIIAAAYFYLFCPAIHFQNPDMWVLAAVLSFVFVLVSRLMGGGWKMPHIR